jgi:hypothetical protein
MCTHSTQLLFYFYCPSLLLLLLLFQTFPFFFGGLPATFSKASIVLCVCTHIFQFAYTASALHHEGHTFAISLLCEKNYFHWGSRNLNQMDRRVCCRADEIWYVWDPTQSRSKALTDVGRWVPGGVNSVSADVHYYQRLYSSSILDIYNVRSR